MQTPSTQTPETRPEKSYSPEGYRTSPDHQTTGWPPGIPYIVGNEACERFSFYGMKAILMVHLIALYAQAGAVEGRANELARGTIHLFIAGVYALPMIGAIIADRLAGKYRTILYISLFYCAGHAALSIWENRLSGVYLGLALIAVGSGGIKPCVSANVGDQFGTNNWFRVRTVYQIFYFSINFGSFFATILIPRIKDIWGPRLADAFPWVLQFSVSRERFGTSLAFAIPGILMFLATFIFWLGRRKFVHVPPKPGGKLGLLDTLSSVCLFLSLGHLFFTARIAGWLPADWPRWMVATVAVLVLMLISAGFLTAGLLLFAKRQQLQPDDGFLAIIFYTLRRFFAGRSEPASDGDGRGEPSLSRSSFWGPAVARFGTEATEGPVAVLKLISVFLFITVFWALFDQHSSSWIEQARMMDLSLRGLDQKLPFLPASVLANEIQALNPLLVMILIPLMNLAYVGCDKLGIRTTPLRRITVGMFITALSFVAAALLQAWIDARAREDLPRVVGSAAGLMASPEGAGPLASASVVTLGTTNKVWWVWQFIPYLLVTIGEVMVSITALEFAYTQAPRRMKSTVMSFLNLTVALGSILVALLAFFGGLSLVNFFWVFAGLMAAAGLFFGLRAYFYVQKDYTQE